MKKFIHLADVHFSKENQDLALASLECALETGKREQIDAWAFAGDLFDRSVANSEASGFPRLVNVIQRMLEVAPIVSIEGTVTHDVPGAYAVLCELDADHPFINLRPDDAQVVAGILFFGMPEAGKEWLFAGNENLSADETNKKLTEAVRSILLGFGAIRAAQPETPSVLLFHGSVKGSTLQNRTVTDDGIGREDLKLAGFDYGALGHVHLEQKIDGVEAYYPGPAYHTDWGHLGVCGFNLVEIEKNNAGPGSGWEGPLFAATVTRIPFPHPRRMKFSLPWPEPAGPDVEGVQAWICYRATKEEAAKIDTESYLNSYLLAGALPGSRVTVELIPTETVRAAEITEHKALADKLLIYTEASGEDPTLIPASVLQKADQLERETQAQGVFVDSAFRIRKMRARGLKGIYKGRRLLRRLLRLPDLPLDDVTVDFDAYGPGALAMIGPTGSGKTTIFRFLAPYSDMPGRPGPLRNYFRLRDSAWELWIADERTGNEYRVLALIDGASKNGATEYHLFKNGEPMLRELEKQSDDFDHKTRRIFGSPELFVRTSYVAQKSGKDNPDLSEATKGERKAIIRELSGLDYLQTDAENAGAKAKAIEAELAVERGRIALLEGQLEALPGIVADVEAKRNAHSVAVGRSKDLEVTGQGFRREAEALAEKVRAQESLAQRIAGLEDQLDGEKMKDIRCQHEINGYQAALDQKDTIERAIAKWDELKEQEGKENARIAEISKERERLTAEHGRAQKTHSDACRKIEGDRAELRTKSATLAGDRNVLQAQIDHLSVELAMPLKDTCPTCGQILPETKRVELHQKRAGSETKLSDLKQKHAESGTQILELGARMAAITLPPNPAAPELPPCDQVVLKRIQGAIAALNIVEARKILATAQEAATRLEEAKKRQADAEAEVTRLSGEIFAAQSEQDATVQAAYGEAVKKLEDARREYGEAQKAVAALEAEIRGLDARIAELEASQADLCERKQKVETQTEEAGEWRYLEQACGPDGIQALEIDAIGPGIAQTANDLLSSVFGSRFSIDFRTTRIAGKGSKTHQVEDFEIWIIDNEDGGSEQEFFTLSGGESVPVRLAIYEAFAKARTQKFSPMIIDEADGSLDPSLRAGYVDMIERAREQAGRRNTILVSHDTAVQEMVAQKVDMAALAKEEMKRSAA